MATQADVRRIALALPGVAEEQGRFAFFVVCKGRPRGLAWVWLERVDPGKARVPNPRVLAVRVANLAEKDAILLSDRERFFTEPHYNGYPAVLVRLEKIGRRDLKLLLADAWRSQAPKALVRQSDAEKPPGRSRARSAPSKRRTRLDEGC